MCAHVLRLSLDAVDHGSSSRLVDMQMQTSSTVPSRESVRSSSRGQSGQYAKELPAAPSTSSCYKEVLMWCRHVENDSQLHLLQARWYVTAFFIKPAGTSATSKTRAIGNSTENPSADVTTKGNSNNPNKAKTINQQISS